MVGPRPWWGQPYSRSLSIWYWGDLDVEGFEIPSRLRIRRGGTGRIYVWAVSDCVPLALPVLL